MKTLLLLLPVGILLTACPATAPVCPPVPTPKSQVIDKTCDVIVRVHARKALGDNFSDPTAKEILKNNEHYDELCDPPK